jgi:tripartite-type tricarboxylate transporter receptor subunit TctC
MFVVLILSGCSGPANANSTGNTTANTPDKSAETKKTNYPTKPITLIVPFAAGGGTDTGARFLAAEVEKILGQPISVVNMPGASGWVGYTELLAAQKDGYTIAQFNDLNVIGGYLDKNQKRNNSLKDFAPIICYVTDPTAISININETRFTTIKELVEYARKNEVTATCAGNSGFIAITKLNNILGTKFLPVRNGGAAESLPAVIGGHVDVMTSTVGETKVPAAGKQIKPLAIMAEERSEHLPDIPTVNEAMGVKGATNSSVRGIAAPSGVDPAIVEILIKAFEKGAGSETFKTKMYDQGLGLVGIIGDDYMKLLTEEEKELKVMAPLLGWE